MLRKFLDYQLSLTEKGRPLHRLRPLISAGDTFLFEPGINTAKGPHIRDAVDLKRWMSIVVLALLPAILMAVWNTGIQKFVYTSGNYLLMDEFLQASSSFQGYVDFALKNNRYLTILQMGLLAFLPIVIISYTVGGLCEAFFAALRGHEIAEGFLVTGILYALVMPPTIPYWMVGVGVAAGIIIGKEFFGGTGMNILNPAITCRAFLFFTFPSKMSGDVWVGTNPTVVKDSLAKMNEEAARGSIDGYSQATVLAKFNISDEIKRVHVDAIASNDFQDSLSTLPTIKERFSLWMSQTGQTGAEIGSLSQDQMRSFVTATAEKGGLGLAPDQYQAAYEFTTLQYGVGLNSDANLFFGNMLGCMGETSAFAAILGAIVLIYTRIGSWRSMLGTLLGAFFTASLFQLFASNLGADGGAWNIAKFGFPAYKHLIMGGLAFGLVFMVTDPVSSPDMRSARWIYGFFIGIVTVVIRTINPAYPEGMMLAILLGNVFAPLFDHYAVHNYRRKVRRVTT